MTATAATDIILQEVEKLDAAVLFKEGTGTVITQIEQHVKSFVIDAETKDGREFAKSLAYKVSRAKTMIDDKGKELVADMKKQASEIDGERKKVRDTLDKLRDDVKAPVEAWETKERQRIEAIECALNDLADLGDLPFEATVELIDERQEMFNHPVVVDFGEYADRAREITSAVALKLVAAREAAVKRAADQAELEVLRAAQRKREEEETAAAREQKKKQDAEDFKYRLMHQDAESDNRAFDAAANAVRLERMRKLAEENALLAAEIKREENKKHRAKIHRAARDSLIAALKALPLAELGVKLNEAQATAIIQAIAMKKVTNVTINY